MVGIKVYFLFKGKVTVLLDYVSYAGIMLNAFSDQLHIMLKIMLA